MRAGVLREFGGPDALRCEEVPTLIPAPGEVLVRVHAVSVNRTLDLKVRQDGGGYGVVLPLILGEAFLQARHLDDRTVSEAVVQSRSCLHDGSNDVPKRLLLKDASGDHALDIIVFSGGLDRARGTLGAS
jgi:hypothetical protein